MEAMEVTEAVSHRRQRLSHVVVRQMRVQGAIGSLGREQREGCSMNEQSEGNICEIHTCSQFHAVSSHVTVTRPENR